MALMSRAAMTSQDVPPSPRARDLFNTMPDTLMPLLTQVNRADCIDFLESRMKAEVTNRFGAKSEMTRLTDDFIELCLSDKSRWQMKVLPTSDSTQVICTVSTVLVPEADSHIIFYSTDWQPLDRQTYLPAEPCLDDFFRTPTDSLLRPVFEREKARADIPLMRASLSPEARTLTYEQTATQLLDSTDAEKLKPYLKDYLIFKWVDRNKNAIFAPTIDKQ